MLIEDFEFTTVKLPEDTILKISPNEKYLLLQSEDDKYYDKKFEGFFMTIRKDKIDIRMMPGLNAISNEIANKISNEIFERIAKKNNC
jgi:hypothetical protein